MRRSLVAIAAGTITVAAGLVAASAASSGGALHWPAALRPAATERPCGGEALSEDVFPPLPPLLLAQQPAPGGTPDAPGQADGRAETFLPDVAALDALRAKAGAQVQMSSFSTSFSHASASQAANIALVAKKLNGHVIPAGARFSYNGTVGPFTAAGGFGWGRMFVGDRIVPTIGGGVCQGASTLYNVVLLANLPVLERHAHGLTVPYLAPGRDATVTESGGLDFQFRNNTGSSLVLAASANNRILAITLYGAKSPPVVEIHTETLARVPFRTEVITDRDLAPGQEEVAAAGQDGVRASAWTIVHGPDGPVRRDLGTHTYRPSPRVILRGPGTPSSSSSSAPASSSTAAPSTSRPLLPSSSAASTTASGAATGQGTPSGASAPATGAPSSSVPASSSAAAAQAR